MSTTDREPPDPDHPKTTPASFELNEHTSLPEQLVIYERGNDDSFVQSACYIDLLEAA